MFLNYLKIAWRYLRKQKLFSLIHIFSLTLGISSAFLIFMYIHDETSYDNFQEKSDHIVRLTSWFSPNAKATNHFARCPNAWRPWVDAFRDEFPEIKNIARLTRKQGTVLEVGEDRFREDYFFYTDKEVFDVLTIPLIAGDRSTALKNPYSIIITESMAAQYPDGNALGQFLNVIDNQGTKTTYQITGIMKDWPTHSHLQIHFLASSVDQILEREWAYIYLLLDEYANPKQLEQKFPDFILKHFGEQAAQNSAYYLQKLKDIHLHSHLDREIKVNGDINTIYVLWIVALFILIITCINYINLSTAQAVKRHKEIGIRRTIGSTKKQLVAQFLTEAVLITILAAVCSFLCIQLALPQLNHLAGKSLNFKIMDTRIGFYLGFVLVIGLLSGIYPALAIARSYSLAAMQFKGSQTNRSNKLSFRNLLVTLQFGISAFLLVCTFILKGQLKYVYEKPLGFNKEQVISVGQNISQNTRSQYQVLSNCLMENPNIVNVSACMNKPSYEVKDMGSSFVESIREGEDRAYLFILPVDDHFFDLMEIEILSGNQFPPSNLNYDELMFKGNFLNEVNSAPRTYILNEAALKQVGFTSAEEAVGKQMDWNNSLLRLQPGPIVGVVKDFHFSTLQKEVKPFVMVIEPRFLGSVLIKLRANNMSATIHEIEQTWNKMFPEDPFEYHFLDDLFAELYANEQQLQDVVSRFTWIAIFIGCLGLFGLVMHSAEQRTKEIGVRKVLGASVVSILRLLTQSYIKWIVIANILVWPIAYYVMRQWLQNFAYHIDLTIWPFLLAGLSVLMIALLTVSWQIVKAATANPVEALKYE